MDETLEKSSNSQPNLIMQFGLEMDGISVREFEVAVDFKYGNSTFLQIIAEIGLVIYSVDSIGYSPA